MILWKEPDVETIKTARDVSRLVDLPLSISYSNSLPLIFECLYRSSWLTHTHVFVASSFFLPGSSRSTSLCAGRDLWFCFSRVLTRSVRCVLGLRGYEDFLVQPFCDGFDPVSLSFKARFYCVPSHMASLHIGFEPHSYFTMMNSFFGGVHFFGKCKRAVALLWSEKNSFKHFLNFLVCQIITCQNGSHCVGIFLPVYLKCGLFLLSITNFSTVLMEVNWGSSAMAFRDPCAVWRSLLEPLKDPWVLRGSMDHFGGSSTY